MSADLGARAAAVLTYHSLADDGSVLSTAPRRFAEQLALLDEAGIAVVPLRELGRGPGGPEPGPPRVSIVFDDGFLSVYEHALPLLQRHGFPATVFLVTDYCGKTNTWPSQPRNVVPRPLLGWAHVREMIAAGVAVGSHTRTHPDLTRLAPREIEAELSGSKQAIEDALGRPVDTLAYPYGAWDDAVRAVAQTHFALACTTRLGYVEPASDPMALPRLDVYYLRRPGVFRRLFSRKLALYLRLRQVGRDLRATPIGG
jgi:peptidoglycan/xylan/chitin deacetylase (PgdA/CDA1 family)